MPAPAPFLRHALAGAAATASGNGLARFAYVPLFPAMVTAGWVDGAEAGTLGAAALLGYLIGTLAGRGAARRLGVPRTLDLGMALVVLALAACAWNGGFWWLLRWRTMAGVAGGLLMALAGPATQARVAAGAARHGGRRGDRRRRPRASPPGRCWCRRCCRRGLPATWLGLAGLVLLLWGLRASALAGHGAGGAAAEPPPRARLLLVTYGLYAAGMVPPMVYLADLAARGRGLGVGIGALLWLVFGLAGVAGGVLSGRVGGPAGRAGDAAALAAGPGGGPGALPAAAGRCWCCPPRRRRASPRSGSRR